MGAITGMGMTMIIVVMWVFLGESIDSDSMISQLEDTGLTDVRLYIAGMIYWIFLNSLLEEYVFRWFITTKAMELLGSIRAPSCFLPCYSLYIMPLQCTFLVSSLGKPLLRALGYYPLQPYGHGSTYDTDRFGFAGSRMRYAMWQSLQSGIS